MKPHTLILVAMLFSTSGIAKAQALPTASRAPLQVGVGGSFASPDFDFDYIKGFTIFGDYSFTRRLSVEADVHRTSLSTPDGIGEDSYLIGPRYSFALEDRATLYVKALGGIGRFSYKPGIFPNPHADTYGIAAAGAGIEFRASPHINIRAIDVEYQSWLGFPPHGLTPIVATIGVAYVH